MSKKKNYIVKWLYIYGKSYGFLIPADETEILEFISTLREAINFHYHYWKEMKEDPNLEDMLLGVPNFIDVREYFFEKENGECILNAKAVFDKLCQYQYII
jgi:hypothetical protein